MSEEAEVEAEVKRPEAGPETALLIYVLYLAQPLLQITAVIGMIWAYLERKNAPEWLQTHYVFMIHTFWKGLLFLVIGSFLLFVFIGGLILLFTFVWWVVRCIKGLKAARAKEPVDDPKRWGF